MRREDLNFDKEVEAEKHDNINDTFDSVAEEGVLIRVPEGTYTVDDNYNFGNYDKIGAYCPGEARLIVEEGLNHYHATFRGGRDFFYGGFTYDHRNDNTGTGVSVWPKGDAVLERIKQVGRADAQDCSNAFAIGAVRKNGSVTMRRCEDYSRGTGFHTYDHSGGNGRIGIWSGSGRHEGKALLVNCHVVDNCNNAIYASNLGENGWFHVKGGSYNDSYGAGVRTGGNGTIIEDVFVEVDMRRSKRDWGGGQPGLRWEVKGEQKTSEGVIRNCDFRMIHGQGGQAIRLQKSAAKVKVENVRVQMDQAKCIPLSIYDSVNGYKHDGPDSDKRIYINGFHVTGSEAEKVPSVKIDKNRDGCVVENSNLPGGIDSKSNIKTRNNSQNMGDEVRERSGYGAIERYVRVKGEGLANDVHFTMETSGKPIFRGTQFDNDGSDQIDGNVVTGKISGSGKDDFFIVSEKEPHISKLRLEGSKEDKKNTHVYVDGVEHRKDLAKQVEDEIAKAGFTPSRVDDSTWTFSA